MAAWVCDLQLQFTLIVFPKMADQNGRTDQLVTSYRMSIKELDQPKKNMAVKGQGGFLIYAFLKTTKKISN